MIFLLLLLFGCRGDKDDGASQSATEKTSTESNRDSSAPPAIVEGADSDAPRADSADSEQASIASGPIQFEWMKDTGVDFLHVSGNSPRRPFPAANGSGVASFDFDLDGLPELYFANGGRLDFSDESVDASGQAGSSDATRGQATRGQATAGQVTDSSLGDGFYQNLSGWQFRDIAEVACLGHTGFTAGIAVSDWNNDGFADLFLNCYGANVLYENLGDGTFSPVELDDAYATDWGTSACFLDVNNDGLLDLYVANYGNWSMESNSYCGDRQRGIRIFCSPKSIEPQLDRLYQNKGDGTFVEIGEASGINQRSARAQGVLAADVDQDGDTDLYVANDLHANSLFLNRGNGQFDDQSELSGAAYDPGGRAQAGMGIAFGDADQNGAFDLVVTNYEGESNAYYRNLSGLFTDDSERQGLSITSTAWVGWGTSMTDFDGDGGLDVLVTNGHTDDNLHLMGKPSRHAQPPLLYHNENGRFQLVSPAAGPYFQKAHVGRGLAISDLDADGVPDVVVGHQDGAPALLRNSSPRRRGKERSSTAEPARESENRANPRDERIGTNMIAIQLIGVESNRSAIGALVHVRYPTIEEKYLHSLNSGGSYLSASQPLLFVPRPAHGDPIKLAVTWPGGQQSAVAVEPKIGQAVIRVVEEPRAQPTR